MSLLLSLQYSMQARAKGKRGNHLAHLLVSGPELLGEVVVSDGSDVSDRVGGEAVLMNHRARSERWNKVRKNTEEDAGAKELCQ